MNEYLKIALRRLLRQTAFTAINIIGLSVSLCGALLIYMYVSHELSYDRFHEKADRIYRLYCTYIDPASSIDVKFPNTPRILVPALKEETELVEEAVRLDNVSGSKAVTMKYRDRVYNEDRVYRADSGFFNMFTAQFIAGDPHSALSKPNSVVLCKSAARRYFGDPVTGLGKTLDINAYSNASYEVTAVVEDFPSNSHFRFNALLSVDYPKEKFNPDNWLSHDPVTYVLLPERSSPSVVEASLRLFTEKVLNPIYLDRFGKTYAEHKATGGIQEYRLQPLKRIHLYSADLNDTAQGNILYVYLFCVVGFMLVCIAGFNYVNLSTAQSAREARAAGIRKLLGAKESQLYKLFVSESMVVVVFSALMAIAIVQVLLAIDNTFLVRFIPYESSPLGASLMLFVLALGVGLFSGMIPAGVVNAFRPVDVLKGQLSRGQKGSRLRQVFVVIQFVVSMILIICTFLVGHQLEYMQQKTLGFNKENLLVIRNVDKLGSQKTSFKTILGREPFVINASLHYNSVGKPHNNAAFTPVELIEQGILTAIDIPIYIGDHDYLRTLGVTLLKGHVFPQDLSRENQQIILNQEALRAFNWQNRPEEELIGKMIDVNGLRYELAGVVQDYHYGSMRQKIGPMAIVSHYYQDYEALMLRIGPGTFQQAIARAKEHWEELAPEVPFEYAFVDEELKGLYESEQNLGILFGSFSGLAIFVACLGLLGLAMFSAERRVKEIGIRKVLGATAHSIVMLLSQDAVRLIALSFLIAAPLAWYLVDRWLENFAYQVDISPLTFLMAGGLTILIAVLTIGFQTLRAALANPAEAIRNE